MIKERFIIQLLAVKESALAFFGLHFNVSIQMGVFIVIGLNV